MTSRLLDTIEIPTADSIDYSVIWLHGLGASGHDFEPIVPELKLLKRPGVRFVFPHAPVRPITINGGAPMRGWYDITSLDFEAREQDNVGIEESVEHITQLIERETARGVAAERIVLAGFSQGGAIALQTGLFGTHQVGGIMALSTYLPSDADQLIKLDEARKGIPIFMAHGQFDDVIDLRFAERSRDALSKHGLTVEWHSYPIPHSVSADEVEHLSTWLKRLWGM